MRIGNWQVFVGMDTIVLTEQGQLGTMLHEIVPDDKKIGVMRLSLLL